MKDYRQLSKAELIRLVETMEKRAPVANVAFEHERLLHELQVHQIELETQNRDLREAQLHLESSRDRYADLFDFAPVGYVTLDDKGVTREMNLTAAGMLGVERTRLIGVPFHLHVLREDLAEFRAHLGKLSKPDQRAATEVRLIRKGGEPMPVVLQSVLVQDAEKEGNVCRTAITDLTARKQAEEALRNNEARLSAILETAVEGIITHDDRGLIESFNQAAEKIFGYAANEMIGRNISLLMPSPDREKHDSYIGNYLRTGQAKIIGIGREVVGQRKDGSTVPMDLSISEVKLTGRRIFTGFVRDITERKQLEGALLRSAEAERMRIAADLHDGICQELVGVQIFAHMLRQKLGDARNPLAAEARRIEDAITATTDHTRQVARGMNPVVADGSGLMHALRQLAGTTARTHRIRCSFQCPAPVSIENPTTANELYRIAQEAIHNALHHGRAKRITVRLTETGSEVCVGVIDNGRGLPTDLSSAPGMGLRVMKYRAGLIGGDLIIQPRKRGGTEVVCRVAKPSAKR